MTQNKVLIVLVVPIKNEAWILNIFLQSASIWADHIIIADQQSDDGSQDIAKKYPKVKLIDNTSKEFNEPQRQKLLINEARKIPGDKLIVALDADEILSGEAFNKDNWQIMLNAPPGSAFGTECILLTPDLKYCWKSTNDLLYFAFRDDGSTHNGLLIHSPRLPRMKNHYIIPMNKFVILHCQYLDWQRMESKHRWYQCYEKISYPQKSAISIYRQYHHMYNIIKYELVHDNWFVAYQKFDISIQNITKDKIYRWDELVQKYIHQYGKKYFKYIALIDNKNFVIAYLKFTQKYSQNILIKCIDKILKFFV